MWYDMLVAGKEEFSIILAVSIALCVISTGVLVIVLAVKVQKQRVSSHI
jgi:hypothetical protein